MPAIEIVPYRSSWPYEFRRLTETIRPLAPPGSELHHIGSTAVPGLAAKDVIDVQLTVVRLDEVDVDAFTADGFVEIPGLSDHAPRGRQIKREELSKLFFRGPGRPANLHVRERGRFNQHYALLCRDFLRAHPQAAKAYESVKIALSERFAHDVEAYCDVKDPVFDIVIAGAELWAEKVCWTEPAGE